ncbi:LPXTG cell wall anchor domain-containing protein [Companilactobacillus mishanensis]|uniref:LPXTG cell wall anchor domain-containing protein n=1 Tax=Companilactobacillus mishanensis TaxID=2486008 RepID=A0ABW9P8W1_9LACO|nr:LPXTG cell wall anchor domain-containing protein [Companilactobacillus mishanensis]MQS45724.1 LPXTG cell wall anchor domain-containing protein [Companilactobacillus mishanensis]
MFRKRGRRRKLSEHRNLRPYKLLFICMAIVIGIVVGLSSNLVHSQTSEDSKQQIYGKSKVTSDVNVVVVGEKDGGGTGTKPKPVPTPNPKPNPGKKPSPSNPGTKPSPNPSPDPDNVSDNNDKATQGETPSVIIDNQRYFPQTGQANDSLSVLFGVSLVALLSLYLSYNLIYQKIND